ncbi:UNVERIFIED_CONTAM: hypothetical protein Sradi_6916900 [Sesamum radiatum]|uniref:Uncharacterized protein n=1 Tax=Sesamum radiatum TaxID=300843 RepID=A0AAW2JHI9_SESRA
MRLGRNLRTLRRILDGKGHPRPASALRRPLAPATPISCPTVHSVHRRPTPMPWPFYVPRPSRTASQSVAQSMCQCPAMIPHGTPKVPSCLPTRLHNMPTVRRRPTADRLSQRTHARPLTRRMSWITRFCLDHPFAREVLPLISRSPRSNLASGPNLGRSCPNVGRPGPTPPVRFPCLSGTLNTPLRCLE